MVTTGETRRTTAKHPRRTKATGDRPAQSGHHDSPDHPGGSTETGDDQAAARSTGRAGVADSDGEETVVPVVSEKARVKKFKEGDRVYTKMNPQSAWEILKIKGAIASLKKLPNGFEKTWNISELHLWEFKYYPEQWVKVKGEAYPLVIDEVDIFRTEPDDGIRYYKALMAPWFGNDDRKTIAQSAIEYEVLEPQWLGLDDGDRVIGKFDTGWISGDLVDANTHADTLEAIVKWDAGGSSKIELRALLPFALDWRVGDRVTEDINTENAYKEGWASERNRTHGTIVCFVKNSGKFYPQIRKADGTLCMVNPDCLKPYEGDEPLPEPEISEPPMTAKQVVEEMEQAMEGAVETAAREVAVPQPDALTELLQEVAKDFEGMAIAQSLEILRVYPKAEQWLISLYHLGQHGFVRGTDLMSLLSRNGKSASNSSATSDRILGVLEADQVIQRGKADLTGDLGYSTGAFRGLEAGKIGDYPRDYAWGWGSNFGAVIEVLKTANAITPSAPTHELTPSDPLTTLASDIKAAHTDCEQALTIARSAESSALEHAKRCGELLLAAKAANGHGGWEVWRNEHTGIPSSTASLYQRIAERWDEVKELKITSLKAIDRHFRESKKQLKSNPQPRVELPTLELKPGDRVTVADGTSTAVVIAIGTKTEIEWQTGQRAKLSAKQIQEYGYRMAPVPLPPVGTQLKGKDGIVAKVVKHDGALAVVNSRDGSTVTSSRLTAAEVERGYQAVEDDRPELPEIDDEAIALLLVPGDPRATIEALLGDYRFEIVHEYAIPTDPANPYKGWQIATDSSCEGLTAIGLYTPWGAWWTLQIEMEDLFEYDDHDRAIEWAQGIIDRLEVAAERAEKPQPKAKKVKVGAGHLRAIAQDQSAKIFFTLSSMKGNLPDEIDLLGVGDALEEAIMQVLEEWILREDS